MFDMVSYPISGEFWLLTKSRQTLLFSATMPAEIRSLANEIMRNQLRSAGVSPD
jgi:superfamily II DNA/RNA helicase